MALKVLAYHWQSAILYLAWKAEPHSCWVSQVWHALKLLILPLVVPYPWEILLVGFSFPPPPIIIFLESSCNNTQPLIQRQENFKEFTRPSRWRLSSCTHKASFFSQLVFMSKHDDWLTSLFILQILQSNSVSMCLSPYRNREPPPPKKNLVSWKDRDPTIQDFTGGGKRHSTD